LVKASVSVSSFDFSGRGSLVLWYQRSCEEKSGRSECPPFSVWSGGLSGVRERQQRVVVRQIDCMRRAAAKTSQ
jgi:hypothetical protein